jgi:UDP-GlcNAc:undecaprenyl-phosphate GlcNAc-1-phosphate transferase
VIATATAFAVALVLGWLARLLGPGLGAMDRPDDAGLKLHVDATPWLGGAAVVGGLAAGLAATGWSLPWAGAVAIAGAFALGLADDALHVPPLARLAAQLGLGVVLAAGGLAADALPGVALQWLAAAVLFAAASNAVNMVDGMDGLAASVATISALGLAMVAARGDHEGPMLLALALAGAAAGFLAHNLPPARLFLGDNGAYVLAAALTVVVLAESRTVAGLLGASTCLGLFFVDLLLAIGRRAAGGAPLFAGDRHHLYDQLQERGLSTRRTLAVCIVVHIALVTVGVRAAGSATAVALATVAVAWVVTLVWLVWSGLIAPGAAER